MHKGNLSDNVVLLVSHERSGSTHFLRSICSASLIKSAGDVLNYHKHDKDDPLSYYGFRSRWLAANKVPESPLDDVLFPLLDAYFEQAVSAMDRERTIFDIKYAHVHALSGFWFSPSSGSLLLKYALLRKIPVIHLYRRSVFAAVSSMHLAIARDIWNAQNIDHVDQHKITLDRESMSLQLADLALQSAAYQHFARRIGALSISYEDLVSKLRCDNIFEQVAAHLNIRWKGRPQSGLVKVSGAPENYISNYSDIADLAQIYADIDVHNPIRLRVN